MHNLSIICVCILCMCLRLFRLPTGKIHPDNQYNIIFKEAAGNICFHACSIFFSQVEPWCYLEDLQLTACITWQSQTTSSRMLHSLRLLCATVKAVLTKGQILHVKQIRDPSQVHVRCWFKCRASSKLDEAIRKIFCGSENSTSLRG